MRGKFSLKKDNGGEIIDEKIKEGGAYFTKIVTSANSVSKT